MAIHDVDDPLTAGAAPTSLSDDEPQAAVGRGAEAQDLIARERDDLRDRLLRKAAEFDNYRKRVENERQASVEWEVGELLREMLSVVDDLERALAIAAVPEAEPYRAGVDLIHRRLVDLLRKRGATPLDSLGADFDPNLHQAIAYEEVAGAREGEVIGEMSKGYTLGKRLLRPAMVKVAKAS